MPKVEHLVICGEAERTPAPNQEVLRLRVGTHDADITLQLENFSKQLVTGLRDVHRDLIELAAYVYAADARVRRGGLTQKNMGENWRRRFRFIVPVRCLDLWKDQRIHDALCETLSFLSDDDFAFEFVPALPTGLVQPYLDFSDADVGSRPIESVVSFSGGMDSFAGAIAELTQTDRSIALVHLRSSSKIFSAQRKLVDNLRSRFGNERVFPMSIWVALADGVNLESTHRTRSFLYAVAGSITAGAFGLNVINLCENGIVSINLPIAEQVVGTLATRTTHPRFLRMLSGLFTAIYDAEFRVENPFIWKTRTEVVSTILAAGAGDLIPHTRSCAHVHEMTRWNAHCGRCSQCIGRRFAVLAAGAGDHDPVEAYAVDLFIGERRSGPDRELALAFIRTNSDIDAMNDVAFFSQFGEINRVVVEFPEAASIVAEKAFELHKRHAADVCRVTDAAIREHAAELRNSTLPPTSLLQLVVDHDNADIGRSYKPPPDHALVAGDESRRPDPARREMILTITDAHQVLIRGLGAVKGANAALLRALAESHRQAVRDELPPERFPFISAADLAAALDVAGDATVRQRVTRFRNEVAALAADAGAPSLEREDLVQNHPWHGYRLNPWNVRIVAPDDVLGSE